MDGVRIVVCVSCRDAEDAESRPGQNFIDALNARAEARGLTLRATPAECLAVCKRPATLAFGAPGKWTYVIGDLSAGLHVDEAIDAALAFAATDNGIVPWKERPVCFRKGVVARVPPLG
jgi:predicted metal-binding protein